MTTKVVRFGLPPESHSTSEYELHLNVSTSAAGSIRVEVQDAEGNAVPGFSIEDCEVVIGDRIDQVVSWNGKSSLKNLVGRGTRLRFVVKDADLFALQVRPRSSK